MGIRSIKEIYSVLEEHLKKIEKPATCVELMDIPEIRKAAIAEYGQDIRVATNKVSDALGLMWRRFLLKRYPASQDSHSLARYMYIWDKSKDLTCKPPVPIPSIPSKKTGLNISEENGGVLIEFDRFTVFVKAK